MRTAKDMDSTMSLTDVLVAPIWAAANVFLGVGAWRVAQRLFPRDTLSNLLLHTTILSYACVLAVSMVLGAIGLLSASSLIAGVVLVTATGCLASHTIRTPGGSSGAACIVARPIDPTGWPLPNGAIWRPEWIVLLGVAACLLAGHVIVRGLLEFPEDWDSLMYHIPFIDHWLMKGSLYIPDCSRWADPANNELIGLWMVAPFSGDFLIPLNNLPATVILGLGTLTMLESLGVKPFLAYPGALLVTANYVVVRQSLDAGNDVALAAFCVAAAAYSLDYLRRPRLAALLLGAICIGVLVGIKYSAPAYAVLLWLVFTTVVLKARRKDVGRWFVAAAICVVALGCYWYVRNVWVSGTPFYPKGFTQQTDALSRMRPQNLWVSTLLGNGREEVIPLLTSAIWKMTGPGHAAAILLLPITVTWLGYSGIRDMRRQRRRGLARLCLLCLLGGCGVIVGITPYGVETTAGTLNMLRWGYSPIRFGLSFLSLAVVGVLVALQDATTTILRGGSTISFGWIAFTTTALNRWLLCIGVLSLALLQLSMPSVRGIHGDGLVAFLVATDLILVWSLLRMSRRRWPIKSRYVAIAGGLASCLLIGAISARWHNQFVGHYDRWFDTRVFSGLLNMPADKVRICACYYRYYPLFGSRRQFHVCKPESPRCLEVLARYLHDRNLNYITVANSGEPQTGSGYAAVEGWIEARPDVFSRVYGRGAITLYSVNSEGLTAILEARKL